MKFLKKLLTLTEINKKQLSFTLVELLVILAIISILILISYPNLTRFIINNKVGSEAKKITQFAENAKLKATSLQSPVRLTIDCRKAQTNQCQAKIQLATFNGMTVNNWENQTKDILALQENILVSKSNTASGFDGNATVNGLYWAIFLPGGKVYSDPHPFDISINHDSLASKSWNISINNDSGRILNDKKP